jgi:uncharacterized membrane protein YfcA
MPFVRDAALALPLGVAVGLMLGLVGGGGAITAVPALVYVLGQDVKEATTASLLIVGTTALVAALDHARGGRVRVRLALVLAVGGAVGAVVGTGLNRRADPDTILFLFAFVLLAAAYAMLRRSEMWPPQAPAVRDGLSSRALPAGVAVGVLTGFFGVGGGFVIVPLLVLAFGLPIRIAVGTSLLVIALSSTAGFVAHLATGDLDWVVTMAFTAGGVAGAFAGSRLSTRVPAKRLHEAFALLIASVAVFVLAETAISMV